MVVIQNACPQMSCNLNSLKGVNYTGDNIGVISRDARSSDYSSCVHQVGAIWG